MSLLEKFILTETMALVTKSAVPIRGVSCYDGHPHIGLSLYLGKGHGKNQDFILRPRIWLDTMF